MVGSILLIMSICLATGVPIAVSFIMTIMISTALNPSVTISGVYIFKSIVLGMNSIIFIAVPLFILAGVIMSKGGISRRLFNFFAYFVGRLTGGLPATSVATCMLYGAISGSGPATTAAVGAMSVPYLTDKGYDKTFSVALVAVAGGLGVIIPPSIPFIIYATLTNQVSVSKMFLAGVLPGILITVCLMAYCYFYFRLNPDKENKALLVEAHKEMQKKGFLYQLIESGPSLLMPVLVLGGIYGGIVTPTEAAAVSCVYAILLSMVAYKTISIRDIPRILKETTEAGVSIYLIVGTAIVFTRFLTLSQVPQAITASLVTMISNRVVFLIVINAMFMVIGMFIDTLSAILIMTPLLLPVATNFGIDAHHFGVIMVVNLAIGFVTPPVGVNLYVASGLFGMNVLNVAKRAVPLLVVFLIALLVITFVPEISLLLIH